MPKPTSHRQSWTPSADAKLRDLAQGNTPTRVIGVKIGRTPEAVQKHASDIGVSLKPEPVAVQSAEEINQLTRTLTIQSRGNRSPTGSQR